MTLNKKNKKIYDALAKLSVLFDNPPSQTRLKAYVEVLNDYNEADITFGIKSAQIECDRFPSLAWLIKKMQGVGTEMDAALQMSGEIIESISRFGRMRGDEAKEYLGEVAWLAVERSGGWNNLCQITNNQVPTTKAQLRDICASQLRTLKKNPDSLKLTSEKRTQQRLSGPTTIGKLLTQKGDKENE